MITGVTKVSMPSALFTIAVFEGREAAKGISKYLGVW